MPPRSKPSATEKTKRSSRGDGGRFLPNLTQLRQASKNLPDPELWPDRSYTCSIDVDDRKEAITFKRLNLKRSSGKTYRWVYDGKLLLRNRDISASGSD